MSKLVSIKDLHPDNLNYNDGSFEGGVLIEQSLKNLKAGRSILLDRNKNIIAGNKTAEKADLLGMKVKIVESDGTEIIAVRRTDLDLNSKEGREMALADNVTAQKNLSWNSENIEKTAQEFKDFEIKDWGVDLSFNEQEMKSFGEVDVTSFDINQTLTLKLKTEQYKKVVEKLREIDVEMNIALLKILGYYGEV